eukprot:2414905-Rhodomonas_salina.1
MRADEEKKKERKKEHEAGGEGCGRGARTLTGVPLPEVLLHMPPQVPALSAKDLGQYRARSART